MSQDDGAEFLIATLLLFRRVDMIHESWFEYRWKLVQTEIDNVELPLSTQGENSQPFWNRYCEALATW